MIARDLTALLNFQDHIQDFHDQSKIGPAFHSESIKRKQTSIQLLSQLKKTPSCWANDLKFAFLLGQDESPLGQLFCVSSDNDDLGRAPPTTMPPLSDLNILSFGLKQVQDITFSYMPSFFSRKVNVAKRATSAFLLNEDGI